MKFDLICRNKGRMQIAGTYKLINRVLILFTQIKSTFVYIRKCECSQHNTIILLTDTSDHLYRSRRPNNQEII